ncbi:hypothetical protein RJ640_008582 [Escallonia rubra]|uniref:K Homology domain-containing protein n=1 Tax=Escallonia rubra TaxID=112253 RepID=A0AA88U430_9ASTE|nr:hypothetical protein RJ640_008582 [Escallonia rubra]
MSFPCNSAVQTGLDSVAASPSHHQSLGRYQTNQLLYSRADERCSKNRTQFAGRSKVQTNANLQLQASGQIGPRLEIHKRICREARTKSTDPEQTTGEAQVANELVDQKLSSPPLPDSDDGKAAEESMSHPKKHAVSMEIGATLMRFVKGKWSSRQKEIEEETGARVIFPSSKKEESITIEGFSADSVARASEKIQVIVDEVIKSPTLDYSHFVSLPLAIHPELVNKLVNFQNSILGINDDSQDQNLNSDSDRDTSDNEDGDVQLERATRFAVKLNVEEHSERVKVDIIDVPIVSYPPKASDSSTLEPKNSTVADLGIEKSIFIKPKTFHLTVLMLKLWNKERVDIAADVLRSVSSKVMHALDNRPISIRLKGLECMRGSLAKARVLYAPVEEIGGEDRLFHACQVIIDAFVEAGLVLEKDIHQKLKLHATLMNARHRKRKKRTRKFDSFDARGVFEQFGSEEWGEYLIREAHLSKRFVFDENGYYHCCASISFPPKMELD